MKGFIEVTTDQGKKLLNISTIGYVSCSLKMGGIIATPGSEGDLYTVKETYDQIKKLIEEAT